MSGIEKWSTTPGSNDDVSPDGFPEGMPPSGVNNSAREVMAAVKTWHLDAELPVYGVNGHVNGYSILFVSTTEFKFASTDRRTIVPVGRRVKAGVGAGVIYGTITASTLSASDTQVTVSFDSGSLDSSLSYVALGIISPSNLSLPNNVDSSFSDVTVAGDLSVAGTASLSDVVSVGDASLSDVWMAGMLSVAGDTSFSDVTATGDISLSDVWVAGTLSVVGDASFSDVTVTGDATLSDVWVLGTLNVSGTVSLSASLETLALRVLADTSLSDVFVAGSLQALGDTSLSDVTATGDISLSDVWVTGSLQALADTS